METMKRQNFQRGMVYLIEAFPSRSEANFDFYFSRLKYINDDDFQKAILYIIDNTDKLYPDDNLIAIIRKRAVYESKLRENRTEGHLKLENRHSSPPPKEWNDMVAKIAKEKEVKP